MTEQEYIALAARTCKEGYIIQHELKSEQAHLWHMATGVAGEAGELLDQIKKHVVYQKELNRQNVVEELGDIYWYVAGLKSCLGITDQEIMEYNIKKLRTRYPDTYSDIAAQARADKPQGE